MTLYISRNDAVEVAVAAAEGVVEEDPVEEGPVEDL